MMRTRGRGDEVFRGARGAKKARPPPQLQGVEVDSFMLTDTQYSRMLKLAARTDLRDPDSFKGVHFYDGFAAYGFVEVVENALRSIVSKCKEDSSQLYDLLLPLCVYFRQRAKVASSSIPGEGYVVVDNLLDVLCKLWRVAISREDATSQSEAWDHCQKFRLICIDELEMYADWSWCKSFVPVADEEKANLIERTVFAHLENRYPWQKGDAKQLLARQSEFLITPEIVEALRGGGANDVAPEPREDSGEDSAPAPSSKTPSNVLAQLRTLR